MSIKERLVFNHSFSEIGPLISRALAVVADNFQSEKAELLQVSCRMVLMEYFTNALKHSGVRETEICLVIEDGFIKISKSDRGNTFNFPTGSEDRPEYPAEPDLTARKFIIYGDDICSLFGIITQPNRISFETTNSDPVVDVSRLHEHYGLMIITKIAQEFFYEYDSKTGENRFSALILT